MWVSWLQIPIKGCRDVCFSNGGQYFAAINGITLSIFNTYTCECVGNLRGHNGKVRSIHDGVASTAAVAGSCCAVCWSQDCQANRCHKLQHILCAQQVLLRPHLTGVTCLVADSRDVLGQQ